MKRFTIVHKNPTDFFRQDLPGTHLPTRTWRRFLARHSPLEVTRALGHIDPARFNWEGWFYGVPGTENGELNRLSLQVATEEVYYCVTDSQIRTQAIFRVLLLAMAGWNWGVVREVIIPELRRRGVSRGYAHSEVDPGIKPWPPYEPGETDDSYVSPPLVERFLQVWDGIY